MPTNDDMPTIDEILGWAEWVHAEPEEAKAAIQNLIDKARLDEAVYISARSVPLGYAGTHTNYQLQMDIREHVKALEAKIKGDK